MPATLPAEVSRSDPEADHILTSSAELRSARSYNVTVSWVVVVWFLTSTRVSLSCTSSQIKTLHFVIHFVITLNSLRKIYQRLPLDGMLYMQAT